MKETANPPIYILLGKGEPALGESHWFGYADLPEDVMVPTIEEDGERYALTLICQLRIGEIRKQAGPHICGKWPFAGQDGLLLFFADVAYYRGDWDYPNISLHPSDNRVCRVIFVPEERLDDLQCTSAYICEEDEAKPIPLYFTREKPKGLGVPELQLFGKTDRLEWETWPEECAGWELLLMMDSMEGEGYNYNFVDCGALCFIIAPEALRAGDFSDVRAIILST